MELTTQESPDPCQANVSGGVGSSTLRQKINTRKANEEIGQVGN